MGNLRDRICILLFVLFQLLLANVRRASRETCLSVGGTDSTL